MCRARERECVCVRERERESVCDSVFVCVPSRERERETWSGFSFYFTSRSLTKPQVGFHVQKQKGKKYLPSEIQGGKT